MKTSKAPVDFFLGAVGPQGFHCYFEELAHEPGRRMYLIKGGPGCGKSTLMKKLGNQLGGGQRIHCASDPDSLDGILLEQPLAAVIDATDPHAMEPDQPGACQKVVDLHHTMDDRQLMAAQTEIASLFTGYKAHHKHAADFIAAACRLLDASQRLVEPGVNTAKVQRYASRLAFQRLPRTQGTPSQQVRLLSAVTPQGIVVFYNTVEALAPHKVVLHDCHGAVAPAILQTLRQIALERGYSIIACPCPLHPQRLEHLFIPQLGLAFLTSNAFHPMAFEGQKNIHCSRFLKPEFQLPKKRLRLYQNLASQLLHQASCCQQDAKALHDLLEQYYQAAVDFAQVDEVAAALSQDIAQLASPSV